MHRSSQELNLVTLTLNFVCKIVSAIRIVIVLLEPFILTQAFLLYKILTVSHCHLEEFSPLLAVSIFTLYGLNTIVLC